MGQGSGTPSVSVIVSANNLQREVGQLDGVAAMVLTSPVHIGQVKTVFNLASAEEAGYTAQAAPFVHAAVKLFYDELGGSQKLYIMGVEDTMTLAQMCASTNANGIKKLLLAGRDITHVFIDRKPGVGYDPGEGFLDVDVNAALLASAALISYQRSVNRPFRLIIAGKVNDLDAPLYEPKTTNNTGAMVVLGNDEDGNSYGALALARTVRFQGHIKIGNGQNGPLSVAEAFIADKPIEDFFPEQLDIFAEAGYCIVHQREGSAGYFFGRDRMAGSDDFRILVHGNIIDKAQRIASIINTPLLETSIRVNDDGKLNDADASFLEQNTQNAILANMQGQISNVQVYVDPAQNVIENPNLKMQVRVLPLGYLTWITIELGLTANLS